MSTVLTILAAALLAAPLVVLVLRGTRFDPSRSTRPDGFTTVAHRARVDAERAARDLSAARSAHEPAVPQPAASAPIANPGRSIQFPGSTSGTKPTFV
jgi:hypothetical protein